MNYNKKTVYDVDVKGKKVLLRCDFNVPQDKKTGEITSDKRIKAALPTIRYLLDNGAAVIACSHLGKPVATFEPRGVGEVPAQADARARREASRRAAGPGCYLRVRRRRRGRPGQGRRAAARPDHAAGEPAL